MQKNRPITRAFYLGFIVLISSGMLLSCQSASDESKEPVDAGSTPISAPVVVEAGAPIINNLDTLPPPTVVRLSAQPAPVRKTVDFYVSMQNFNTEDGLALSSLICSYKDSAGNLWFGTSGNGVSMYNGKTFTNYSLTHGLIHNLISTITEDSEGNMWFGTYGGASKFNGITFENFTTKDGLPDNNVRKIVEDEKGNIWLGTSPGVSRYIPENKEGGQNLFINYTAEDGFAGGAVIDIMEDQNGILWFGSANGISRYNPAAEARGKKAFENVSEFFGLEDEMVYSILEDNEGIIWVGTDGFVSRYDPVKEGTSEKPFTHFTVADGLVDNFVISSMKDREGNLWFGTKGGVSRYSKADRTFLNFTTKQGLANNQVESITEDHSGSIWFSTYGSGLSKYDGSSLIEFTAKQGLPGKAIYASTEDKKGNLWFAPLDGGIVEYRRNDRGTTGGTFINYTTAQGFTHKTALASAVDSKGNLWFGTARGLCKYDGVSFTTYTEEQGLPDDYITALHTDKAGNLWIGTYSGGLSKFDGKSFTNFSTGQGLVHQTVWYIFEDNNGIIWIATRGGLSRFDGARFMNFTTAQGMPDNKLSTVTQDRKGNLLIGSWGGGAFIIKKKDVEKLAMPEVGWNTEKSIFEHFSTTEGLANDVVYSIIEDRAGNIVIGTSYGFTVLKGGLGSEGNDIAKGGIENYNEKTGYPIKDVSNNYSMIEDSRGFIWAGTADKLVRFDYGRIHKSNEPPNVFIKSIKINNETISWHSLDWARKNDGSAQQSSGTVSAFVIEEQQKFGRKLTATERDTLANRFSNVRFDSIRPFAAIPENLVLPYANNNISFDFIGIETARPHLIRYRYKLEGNDESWSPVTNEATAAFGNIFEGSYTFMVQAQSPDGVWSEPLLYKIKILPPWYRSWFAYLFYTLIFIGGMYSVHRVQKSRTIRKEREKTQRRELEQARKIEKAYRELEIEAALEKVRVTGVAMRHTSELQEVVNTVSRQLKMINININGGVFIVINEEVDRDVPIWGSGGAADYVQKAVVPFLAKPIFTCLRDAIKERRDFWVEEYTKEEKDAFFRHLFNHHPWTLTPPERKKELLSLEGGYTRSLTVSPNTSIFIINNTGQLFSDEANDILKRFGNVFEQIYMRFLDLQKAEAQAKEGLRQASLDRVRGEIASMRSTEDLRYIAQVVFNELTALDVPFIRCGVFIVNKEAGSVQAYLTAPDGQSLGILNLSRHSHELIANIFKSWKDGHIYKEHWNKNDFVRWTKSMMELGQISDENRYRGNNAPPESLELHFIPFVQGMLYVGSDEPLTKRQLELAQNLADTFAVAYARYDDFNRLEHAKEKAEGAFTELKAIQQQLVQTEKLASLGQLTAGIAHEIKNPLNFVNNFSEVSIELIEEVKDELSAIGIQLSEFRSQESEISSQKSPFDRVRPPVEGGKIGEANQGDVENQAKNLDYTLSILSDIETNLRKIHEHGHRADRIVKSMLQHSRGGSGKMEPTNVNTLVKEFVNLAFHGMRAGKHPMNVDIEFVLDEQAGEVPLIAEDFSRVVVNLCNNAFDAMREKADVESETAEGYSPKLSVKTHRGNEQIIVEIEDNGPGIPEEMREKILQPFFTTKKGTAGTGLGLSITNDIIKAHGGTLEIKSEPGIFTKFIIKIPTQMSAR